MISMKRPSRTSPDTRYKALPQAAARSRPCASCSPPSAIHVDLPEKTVAKIDAALRSEEFSKYPPPPHNADDRPGWRDDHPTPDHLPPRALCCPSHPAMRTLGYGSLRNRTALATEESHDVTWHQRSPFVSPAPFEVAVRIAHRVAATD